MRRATEPQKYRFSREREIIRHSDYAKLFLRYDADVSQQNKEGWTALDTPSNWMTIWRQ